ncbi:MAG TPA: hypothetical protein VJI75_02135 [Candidatus Nanoarchaeia archaeon]|nr:hypothetical protein [Candidatus Nanoarchaeia archaeon]
MLKNAYRFFKAYSNLPLEERKNPIMVIDDDPISWNLAYEEINNETKNGEEILKNLIDLEIV